jgi:osmotically-inducible protein OsmY
VVPDDDTLVARVRSEVLRNGTAGQINVDAYEGCVTLRGQLDHYEDIQRIVHRTRHVDGVREIRSYLHLPGTLPPNKAEIYLKERVPAHLAGGDQGIGLAN